MEIAATNSKQPMGSFSSRNYFLGVGRRESLLKNYDSRSTTCESFRTQIVFRNREHPE
jgi:hypothetical protein